MIVRYFVFMNVIFGLTTFVMSVNNYMWMFMWRFGRWRFRRFGRRRVYR